MTKSYKMLQKKLQELESKLVDLFSHPSKTPSLKLLSDDIQKQFLFLNNLLSTEISSHPSKPHDHLHHIANRLNELETAFTQWDESEISPFDNLETDSVCSCTDQSCLNDDGGDGSDDGSNDGSVMAGEDFAKLGFTVYDVPEILREGVREGVIVADEKARKERVERVVKREEGKVGGVVKYIGALVSGVMIGAVMMVVAMVNLYDDSQIMVYGTGHLVPT